MIFMRPKKAYLILPRWCMLKSRDTPIRAAGVKHLVLEKAAQLTKHPQAHFINNRTMEVSPRV